jgi:hypothetical protein
MCMLMSMLMGTDVYAGPALQALGWWATWASRAQGL